MWYHHGLKTMQIGGLMNKIDDFTFAQGIGFLIKNKIIQINDLPTTSDGEIAIENDIAIPSWIKNNAGWWANDSISDLDFLIWT